jgi:hypothetical protein
MSEIWDQVKPRLERFSKPFPTAAIVLANQHREEVAPHLIACLEAIATDPSAAADGDYMLHLYAMHMLAAWREAGAYRPLAQLGRHPDDILDYLLGDTLTEGYDRCLASVCDGDLAPLKALAEDTEASYWARNAAIGAMAIRVLEGDGNHDELAAYLAEYGDAEAARLRAIEGDIESPDILDAIAGAALDIGASSLLERLRSWFADDLLDPTIMDLDYVERCIGSAVEEWRQHQKQRNSGYVTDAVKEMSWWASFSDDDQPRRNFLLDSSDRAPDTYIREGPKIGRNDPCPCGSGRKYKKCHGAAA